MSLIFIVFLGEWTIQLFLALKCHEGAKALKTPFFRAKKNQIAQPLIKIIFSWLLVVTINQNCSQNF